jgi:hypothetical protein
MNTKTTIITLLKVAVALVIIYAVLTPATVLHNLIAFVFAFAALTILVKTTVIPSVEKMRESFKR